MTIRSSWLKTKTILSTKMAVADSFRVGATEAEINSLKCSVDAEIPEDFITLYKTNNGQNPGADFLNFNRILPISEIIEGQQMLNEVLSDFGEIDWLEPDKIRNLTWSSNWIKFTEFEGDGFVLDLDPGPNGTYGQIFYRYHADNSLRVCAQSISEFISLIAKSIETGDYEIHQECVTITKLF